MVTRMLLRENGNLSRRAGAGSRPGTGTANRPGTASRPVRPVSGRTWGGMGGGGGGGGGGGMGGGSDVNVFHNDLFGDEEASGGDSNTAVSAPLDPQVRESCLSPATTMPDLVSSGDAWTDRLALSEQRGMICVLSQSADSCFVFLGT